MVFGVDRSNGAICSSMKSKMAADGHLGYTTMAITSQTIDVMSSSVIRFSGSADLMVLLSMTLSDPERQFQGHSIV